jgi:hypothetical protein
MQAERALLRAALQDQLNQRFLSPAGKLYYSYPGAGNFAVSIGCWLPETGAQESLNWVSHLQLSVWMGVLPYASDMWFRLR